MKTARSTPTLGVLLVFLAGVLWGSVGFFVKELERAGSTPELTGLLRVFFAFLMMAAACLDKYGPKALRIDRRTLLVCVLLGLVCHGIYNIFYSTAVTLSGVSVSAVLLNIAPVFTLLFSALLFGERLTVTKALAIAINILGCALTATNGQLDLKTLSVVGVLCGVASGVCYALTSIFGRLASGGTNAVAMSMYSYFFASIFLALWNRPWQGEVHLSGNILIWGFLYALIPTAIAYALYYQGLQSIPDTSKVPVISSIEAVIAAVTGVVIYRERLGLFSIIGMVLVLASIAVMNLKRKEKRADSP